MDVNIPGVLDNLLNSKRDDVLIPLKRTCLNGATLPREVEEYLRDRDMSRHGVLHQQVVDWVTERECGGRARKLIQNVQTEVLAIGNKMPSELPVALDDWDDLELKVELAGAPVSFSEPNRTTTELSQTGLADRMPIGQPIQLGGGKTRLLTSDGHLEFRDSHGQLTARYKL